MRRKLLVLLVVSFAVLATAGAAYAANGGFTPETPHSPNAARTNDAYYLILGFTSFIFVLVEGLLIAFVWKYRSRGRARTVEGAQVHGHTRLELMWTAFPIVILAVIAAFVFYELPGIKSAPAASNPIHVTVEGHQFYWQFDYPNGARSFNTLHVPVGAVVDLKVISADVIHSWWVPSLGGKIQAIPGRTNHFWFQATDQGLYTGQCAELCGDFHASMKDAVQAEPQAAYQHYVSSTARATLGKSEWTGVCATCHGMKGTGGYGPDISSNAILASKTSIAQTIRNGVDTARPGVMPPVGNTWTQEQIAALAAYVKTHIYKGATTSGG
ncbi:MAG: cytochrome c oxidase subunit II [Actinobacteria bacterium]|nr:cytochrome c oxidase subunit II [Actinomycetota bacterium]MBV8562710.1 cytochrome c oxidase subunit II [Actinomycetota bacterium]